MRLGQRTVITILFGLLLAFFATGSPGGAPAGATGGPTSSSRTSSALRSWIKLHDVAFLSLQTDLEAVSTDDDNGSTTAISAACQQLEADVATIARIPPIPDRAAQRHWTAALRDFRRGALDCVQGIVRDNQAMAVDSGPLLRSGVGQVNAVLAALKKSKG